MSSFTQEPTCTTDGFTIYIATYDGHTENNKVIATGSGTGHTYVEPTEEDWVWAEHGDTFTAKVTLTCRKNDFTVTIGASVSKTEDVPASLTAPGYKVFTATAEAEGKVEHYHCTVCGKNFSDAEGTDELTTVTIDKLPIQDEPTTEKQDHPAPQNPDNSGSNAKGKCPYCGGTHYGFFGWFV